MSGDIVYVNRPGDDNEELRYSLRSVEANLPGRRVWVAGYIPSWVTNVGRIELPPLEDKHDNQIQTLKAVCEHPDVSDTFWMFNDDFYVMQPMDTLPVYHLGPLADYVTYLESIGKSESNPWFQGLRLALQEMRSWGLDPLCYETHSPLPYRKRELAELIDRATVRPLLYAAFYAATQGQQGAKGMDAKAGKYGDPLAAGWPYLSSVDRTFNTTCPIGRKVRAVFPQPSKFEVTRV